MLTQSTFAFICQSSNGQTHVFKLGNIVPTFYSASNSVILSLAAYLTWRYPSLHHPKYMDYPLHEVKVQESFPISELSLHPLYEPWCDTLCESVIQGSALRSGSTLYLLIWVTEEFIGQLVNLNWKRETFMEKISINRIFNLQHIDKKKNKIILMNFATSQLRQNQLLPKIHLPALLMGTLFNNQKWSYYCILKGEVPTKEELVSADTLIFPGSSNSVLDKIPLVQLLVSQLNQAYLENPKLKIMSICYGHQLVARIHGASIVRKNRFEGHQLVGFNKQLTSKYKFLQKITDHMEKDFIMPEHHEDYVEDAPEGFDLIATSNSCFVEAMVKKDGRILSLQFHPQYLSEYTIAFTKRAQLAKAHFHASFALYIEPEKLNVHHQCCNYVRQCMKAFIESIPQ